MTYYKHHIFLNSGKTLIIDSDIYRPKSTSNLITIEEMDSKDLFTIPMSSYSYIRTEIINSGDENNIHKEIAKQDPYNGIMATLPTPTITDQMDK